MCTITLSQHPLAGITAINQWQGSIRSAKQQFYGTFHRRRSSDSCTLKVKLVYYGCAVHKLTLLSNSLCQTRLESDQRDGQILHLCLELNGTAGWGRTQGWVQTEKECVCVCVSMHIDPE